MRIKEGVPETAAALRKQFGKEALNKKEVAQALGISEKTLWRRGYQYNSCGKMAVETVARIIVG